MFKVNNKDNHLRRSGFFIVNFEQVNAVGSLLFISHTKKVLGPYS